MVEKRYADIDKLVEAHSFFALDAFMKSRHVVEVKEIRKAMTVDAVEVVRCKDCGHRGDPVMCPMCYEEWQEWDDDGYHDFESILHDYATDEGFCHMGERGNKCD